MFNRPPWSCDPMADMQSLIASRYSRRYPHSRLPFTPPLPDYRIPHCHRGHGYPRAYKHMRFSDVDTPSTSEFSSSEHEDSDRYTFDFDKDDERDKYRLPSFPPLRQHGRSRDVRRVPVKLPSETAEELRSDEVLILPRMTHLHIRMRNSYTRDEETIRAAVGSEMRFGDVVKQVVSTYFGDGVRSEYVRAYVKQRGRWDEPSSSARIEDLRDRGEVFREGRREMEVRIEIGDDGHSVRERTYIDGRGPRGGRGRAFDADVEKVYERRESRVRVGGV